MNIVFFGSTSDSVLVLDMLLQASRLHLPLARADGGQAKLQIKAVITQPPRPVGRSGTPIPTPVETWGKKHDIPVLTFATDPGKPWLYQDEEAVINTLSTEKPDLLVTACYGQKIPADLIKRSTHGGVNVHPSLLPRWRGADPIPWTILSGDAQTGVTIVTVTEKFDQGKILAQKKISLTDDTSTDELRTELFRLGADLLVEILPSYIDGSNKGKDQDPVHATTAKKLKRSDGYIPWEIIQAAIEGKDTPDKNPTNTFLSNARLDETGSKRAHCPMAQTILRALRALSPWPGVWSEITIRHTGLDPASISIHQKQPNNDRSRIRSGMTEMKRLKILEAHIEGEKLVLDTVQLEGKNPVSWDQFKKSYGDSHAGPDPASTSIT